MEGLRVAQADQSEPPPSPDASRSNEHAELDAVSDPRLLELFEQDDFTVSTLARRFGTGDKVRQRVRRKLLRAGQVFFDELSFDEIARRLQELQPGLGEHGPSVRDVARALGVSPKRLKDWLANEKKKQTLPAALRPEWIEFLRR